MYVCNENVKILNDIPLWHSGTNKGKVNRKDMVGMNLAFEYYGSIYDGIKVVDYYICDKTPRFSILYNGKYFNIICKGLLSGQIGKILDVDLNNKYIDEDNVVHIFIKAKDGKCYEALYSGSHTEEVMNSNWYVVFKRGNIHSVNTAKYKDSSILLHQVDLGSFVDHINNNPLDNRIENLIVSNQQHNAKNRKAKNEFGITGLRKNGNGWYSRFVYEKNKIVTKTRYDLEEAKIDNLISQRYLSYRHNNDMFYLLNNLPIERIKEVESLLDDKISHNRNKILKIPTYNYEIEDYDKYKRLIKNKNEMLLDCNIDISNILIWKVDGYWACSFVENNCLVENKFHKEVMGIRANDYYQYNIHIDHLNNNANDNRSENLIITTNYGNQCNKIGKGYNRNKNGSYVVAYMRNYKFWDLIGGIKRPTYKTEQEAIDEVSRRKEIIDNVRVKLKSREELDSLIKYCLDNGYLQENGLADLDLGYLYWKEISKKS